MPDQTASPSDDMPVAGVRGFLADTDGSLYPANTAFGAWVPGDNTARCRSDHGDDAAPHPRGHRVCGGNCGYNAFTSTDAACEYWQATGGDEPLLAAVCGWGDIEVHHGGWRAQHARVVAIARPTTGRDFDERAAARAAARYRVPLVGRSDLDRLASEHGRSLTDDELPGRSDTARCTLRLAWSLVGGPAGATLFALAMFGVPAAVIASGAASETLVTLVGLLSVVMAMSQTLQRIDMFAAVWPLTRRARRAASAVTVAVTALACVVIMGTATVHHGAADRPADPLIGPFVEAPR